MAEMYKLKGLNKLDLKPGEKKEVEVEGLEEGKILLLNVNGKHSALGSKCTHYGEFDPHKQLKLELLTNRFDRSTTCKRRPHRRRSPHLPMARCLL